MGKLKESFAKYGALFDSKPQSQKLIIAAGVLIAIFLVWYFLLWKLVINDAINLESAITTTKRTVVLSQADLQIATAKLKKASAQYSKQLLSLTNKQEIKKPEVKEAEVHFVAPQKMIQVLKDLMVAQKGLTLISLRKLPVQAFKAPITKEEGAKQTPLFQQGLVINLTGDYFAILRYLASIEQLKWPIFWDRLNYTVGKYPLARVEIEIHTISDKKGWLYV